MHIWRCLYRDTHWVVALSMSQNPSDDTQHTNIHLAKYKCIFLFACLFVSKLSIHPPSIDPVIRSQGQCIKTCQSRWHTKVYIIIGHSSCKQMVQLLTEKRNTRRPVFCVFIMICMAFLSHSSFSMLFAYGMVLYMIPSILDGFCYGYS